MSRSSKKPLNKWRITSTEGKATRDSKLFLYLAFVQRSSCFQSEEKLKNVQENNLKWKGGNDKGSFPME